MRDCVSARRARPTGGGPTGPVGVDPDLDREEFVAELLVGREVRKHHPTWDAEVSALAVLKAVGQPLRPPAAEGEPLSAISARAKAAISEGRLRKDWLLARTTDLSGVRQLLLDAAQDGFEEVKTQGLPVIYDPAAGDHLVDRIYRIARELEPEVAIRHEAQGQYTLYWGNLRRLRPSAY